MINRQSLDRLYRAYNRPCYIDPDPLLFLHRYNRVEDREIVGLIASSLAFGRVAHICASVERVLAILGPAPRAYLDAASPAVLESGFTDFRHRYASGRDLIGLLRGIQHATGKWGSLNRCFVGGLKASHPTVIPALSAFVEALDCGPNYLLPHPELGSACKRLHLFLRWMVRHDDVDPGGWTGVSRRQLIVPLDTHMARISKQLGLTRRASANGIMALEITDGFRRWAPRDPVKYDFALTRFGIRAGLGPLPF
ncbi:MAG: TIGR02757 family protein [Kiritimatiellia bacterium]